MSVLTESTIIERLKSVKFPGYSRDIVSFGLVKEVKLAGGDVLVRLAIATNNPAVPETIKREAENAVSATPGVTSAQVVIDISSPPDTVKGSAGASASGIPGGRTVIAVASGRGGGGKSNVGAKLT